MMLKSASTMGLQSTCIFEESIMRKTNKKAMNYVVFALLSFAALSPAVPAIGQTKPAAQTTHYSVEKTQNGKLIDDPASAAILKKLIPSIWENEMFQTMGRDQTLRGVQQFEPALTDAKLAEIQAELNKIPGKE